MYSVVLATLLTAGAGADTGFCRGRCQGCHGCYGYAYSCHGCYGCYGCHGCYGCCGCWGSYVSYSCHCSGCWGCHGCCGGVVVYPSCSGCCGGMTYATVTSAAVPYTTTRVTAAPVAAKPAATQTEPAPSQTARITVKLPSSARLWVDNVNCPLTSEERSFTTPALVPGQQYFYTLRMEVDRDGQTVSESRRVFIAAGQRVNVDFNAPATVTAQR